jgi:Zn-dependent peptidase ImmA (M78 family)/transcriptional regulator with XRE-family HTH domain
MPQINPEILCWARETAGLSLEEAAALLHVGGRRLPGPEALQQYEEGVTEPTRPLLLRMAKLYRRPLLTFYLEHPPKVAERGEDFRTLPADRKTESAAPLDALVRDIHVRQRLVRATLEDADEAKELSFVGSISLQDGIDKIVGILLNQLEFDLSTFRRKRTVGEAFGYLRSQVEGTGVFVLLIGNLGSHHSNISAEVFRGFALADKIAPFVVINDQDAKSAWAFTLLHEVAHIWLGQTGISGGGFEHNIERFCNEVASQLLLPDGELAAWPLAYDDLQDLVAQISEFASLRRISRSMVAYRLFQARKITREIWVQLSTEFHRLWVYEKVAERLRGSGGGGPDYYLVRRHRVGGALINLVRRTLADGLLTPTKAGKVLGVRPVNVEPMLAQG